MSASKSLVVVFDSTFESLLSTALICEAMGANAVHKDNLNKYMLAENSQFIHTENQEGSLQFEEAMRIYTKRKGNFR